MTRYRHIKDTEARHVIDAEPVSALLAMRERPEWFRAAVARRKRGAVNVTQTEIQFGDAIPLRGRKSAQSGMLAHYNGDLTVIPDADFARLFVEVR